MKSLISFINESDFNNLGFIMNEALKSTSQEDFYNGLESLIKKALGKGDWYKVQPYSKVKDQDGRDEVYVEVQIEYEDSDFEALSEPLKNFNEEIKKAFRQQYRKEDDSELKMPFKDFTNSWRNLDKQVSEILKSKGDDAGAEEYEKTRKNIDSHIKNRFEDALHKIVTNNNLLAYINVSGYVPNLSLNANYKSSIGIRTRDGQKKMIISLLFTFKPIYTINKRSKEHTEDLSNWGNVFYILVNKYKYDRAKKKGLSLDYDKYYDLSIKGSSMRKDHLEDIEKTDYVSGWVFDKTSKTMTWNKIKKHCERVKASAGEPGYIVSCKDYSDFITMNEPKGSKENVYSARSSKNGADDFYRKFFVKVDLSKNPNNILPGKVLYDETTNTGHVIVSGVISPQCLGEIVSPSGSLSVDI